MVTPRGIVVFSGGSAANSLVDVFGAVRQSKECPLSYIIPISDNGGSSSELIRVFGGPGIGDVRSKLLYTCHLLFCTILGWQPYVSVQPISQSIFLPNIKLDR